MTTILIAAFIGFGLIMSVAFCVWAVKNHVANRDTTKEVYIEEIKNLRDTWQHYDQRLSLIEQHTGQYVHSVGVESVQALQKSHKIMSDMKEFITQLEFMVNQNMIQEYEDLRDFMGKRKNELTTKLLQGAETKIIELQDWQVKLEDVIQATGSNIAHASKEFHEVGIVRPTRQRKPTFLNLKAAGIRVFGKVDKEDEESSPEPPK